MLNIRLQKFGESELRHLGFWLELQLQLLARGGRIMKSRFAESENILVIRILGSNCAWVENGRRGR